MKRALSILCFGLWSLSASAQTLSDVACERLLIAAETKPDTLIYDDCGFNDEFRAWNQWAPLATAHDMKRALFELCRRYPNHAYGPLYCEKAIKLNFGPALAYKGYELLHSDKNKEALSYFNRAIKSGDLTHDELRKLTETLGILYLSKGTPEYAPDSAIALLTKAADDNSAVANNALAYLSYSGEHRVKKDDKKALSYLWKSILLGCPAAEENLGAYHLARQRKISLDDATYYMSLQAFTCTPFDKNIQNDTPVIGCDCNDILTQEAFFKSQPYFYLALQNEKKAILRDPSGNTLSVEKDDILPDGSLVQEIRPTLISLIKNGKKEFINRYHTGHCVDQCLKYATDKPKRRPIGIKPYHLTFTEQECLTIDYYAKKLMDTNSPYTGKKECNPSAEADETAKLLLKQK